MASSGGGKVRNKRPRGAKKPYQRPKSILSQVSEAVTGMIVPTWLKSMWARTEDEKESHVVTSEPTSPEFDPDTPSTSYGTGYPPVQMSHRDEANEEYHGDRLFRREGETVELGDPPRKHTPLPFTSYTQPIQTSTPVDNDYVPPQRDAQTETQDDETDSSVSTSGCSSLLPHVDRADHKEKIAKSNLDQLSEWGRSSINTSSRTSLWSESNIQETSHSQIGSRQVESKPQPAAKRPRFNASYFGTPRQNLTLTPGERHQSSFYAGRTTFGGSSFYRSPATKKKYNPSPYEVHLPLKRHIRPKAATARTTTDPDFAVTSNTAMKILNTLNRMSTPLSDAKRIPLTPVPSPFAFKPRRVAVSERLRPAGPPVSGLQVGERAKVIPNIQPPLPKYPASNNLVSDSPVVASPVPSVSTTLTYMSNPHRTPGFAPAPKNTPVVSTFIPTSSPPRSGGKMKTKSRNQMHYSASRDEEEDVVEVPDLPNIALPISRTAMPTFNFGDLQSNPVAVVATSSPFDSVAGRKPPPYVAPGQSKPAAHAGKSTASVPPKSNGNSTSWVTPLMSSTPFPVRNMTCQFKFTSPKEKQAGEEGGTMNDFQFSEPAVKSLTVGSDDHALATTAADEEFTFSVPNQKDSPGTRKNIDGFSFSKPVARGDQREEEEEHESSGGIKIPKSLKSGSCLQALGIASSKPTSKAEPSKNTSLMDKFNPAIGSWECTTCLVRNVIDSLKCVACLSNKPGTNVMSRDLQTSSGFTLADKFKPPAGSWECETCLVRNNAEVKNCVACNSSRPSSIGIENDDRTVPLSEKFKPPQGSWECDTCMVQNNPEVTNCVACESKRPAATGKSNSRPESSGSSSLAEMFKPPEGAWSCDTCLVQNRAMDLKCVACQSLKPGNSAAQEDSQTGGFSIQGTAFKLTAPLSFGSNSSSDKAKLAASVKPSLSDMFKPEAGSWECDTCMVENKPSCSRCVACETPKPGSEPPLRTPPASSFKFGTGSSTSASSTGFKIVGSIPSLSSSGNVGFKLDSGATIKDSSTHSNLGFKIPAGGIKFGSIGSTSKQLPGAATSSDTVSSSAGFSLGLVKDNVASSGGLNFQPSKSVADSSKVADSSAPLTSGFKLGESNDEGTSKKSTMFTFGASSTTDEKDRLSAVRPGITVKTAADVTSQSSTPGFQFGSKPSEPSQSSIQTTPNVKPFQSSLTSTDSKPAFTFGGPISNKSTLSASVANPIITNQSSSSSFHVTTTALPSANSNAFQFGSTGNSNKTTTSFAAPVKLGKRKESEPSSTSTEKEASFKPTFNFTGSNPSSNPPVKFGRTSGPSNEQKPSLTFGVSKAPTGAPQSNASPFQFGTQSKSDAPVLQSSSSPFMFGAKHQQSQVTVSNASGFQFGTVSSSSSQNSQQPEKKQFNFGAVAATPAQPSVSNSFAGFDSVGNPSTNSAVPSFGGTSSAFGSGAPLSNNSTAASLPGEPSRQQNSTPVFGQSGPQQNSFGSATTNAVPAFGSGSSGPLFGGSGSSGPSFGGSVSSGPSFGGSVPAFGSNSQSTGNNTAFPVDAKAQAFQFGQNNNNSSSSTGAFTFGANPTAPSANTNQAGFTFNASQPPTFNFGAAAPPPPPASNQTSTFMFGGTPTTEVNPFNAVAPPSGRRIKKAVRRTGRKT